MVSAQAIEELNKFDEIKWNFYKEIRGHIPKENFDVMYDDLGFVFGTHETIQKEIRSIVKRDLYLKLKKALKI